MRYSMTNRMLLFGPLPQSRVRACQLRPAQYSRQVATLAVAELPAVTQLQPFTEHSYDKHIIYIALGYLHVTVCMPARGKDMASRGRYGSWTSVTQRPHQPDFCCMAVHIPEPPPPPLPEDALEPPQLRLHWYCEPVAGGGRDIASSTTGSFPAVPSPAADALHVCLLRGLTELFGCVHVVLAEHNSCCCL